MKRLDAVSGPFGRTDFVRHALLEAIERAEAKLPKPVEKAPSKPAIPPKTPKPWHETCGWEEMRDTVHSHLRRIKCESTIATAWVGYDTPEAYWQKYYADKDYEKILDQLELVRPQKESPAG